MDGRQINLTQVRDAGEKTAAALTELWNRALRDAPGFFPLPPGVFAKRILQTRRFANSLLLLAEDGGRAVGMAHLDLIRERFYPEAGVVELVAVDPDYRGRGLGSRLLQTGLDYLTACGARLVDGGGAWPYCPYYATLIDGSERSGVFAGNAAARGLFAKFGFSETRRSLVMRVPLAGVAAPPEKPGLTRVSVEPRAGKNTWLDYCFRGWGLHDHHALGPGDALRSRAIFAKMEGTCLREKNDVYAVFGVYTPEEERGRGWATANIARLLHHLSSLGGARAELHVYADNLPAVRLYSALGFKTVDETLTLRREI